MEILLLIDGNVRESSRKVDLWARSSTMSRPTYDIVENDKNILRALNILSQMINEVR